MAYNYIDSTDVTLQVESDKTNVWVTDGIAAPQRSFNTNGLLLDARTALVYTNETEGLENDISGFPGWLVKPIGKLSSRPITWLTYIQSTNSTSDYHVTITQYKEWQAGPILIENRIPIVVKPGMKVNFSGSVQVRPPDGNNVKDENDTNTNINIKFSLWAVGTVTDAFGVATDEITEVMYYQDTLRPVPVGTGFGASPIYTIPVITDAVIPANADRLYFTVATKNTTTLAYQSIHFQPPTAGGLHYVAHLFVPDSNPFKVYIKQPDAIETTVANTLSSTGAAFKNRDIFDNTVADDINVTYMGTTTRPTRISIYNWSGSRGSLITTDSVALNTRKTITISPSASAIEIAKAVGTPMGIDKSGTQAISQSTYTQITTFTTRSGFPSTVVSSNALVVAEAGILTLDGSITFGAASTSNKGYRVKVNGSIVGTHESTANTATVTGSDTLTVNAGALITFEGMHANATAGTRTIQTSTNFHFTSLADDFYIESVVADTTESLVLSQDQNVNVEWLDIIDDVAKIETTRPEADAGLLTVSFCSVDIDPHTSSVLSVGKKMRLLGRHYGVGVEVRPDDWDDEVDVAEYSVIFTGWIKRIETTYNYKFDPIIKITVQDAFPKLDKEALGVLYNEMDEYIPILPTAGVPVFLNGYDLTGESDDAPSGYDFFPSASGTFTLADALIVTRNTHKQFLIVDRFGRLIISDSISTTPVITFTDGTAAGDYSMGRVAKGLDTDSIINIIEVNEQLINRKDFVETRTLGSEDPPVLFKAIQTTSRSVHYKSEDSVREFGEYSKKFQVARGSGRWEDIIADNYGTSFEDWANDILDDYDTAVIKITSLTTSVKHSDSIRFLSELEVLDTVEVVYKTESHLVQIREIKHTITPGKWVVSLSFVLKADSVYW